MLFAMHLPDHALSGEVAWGTAALALIASVAAWRASRTSRLNDSHRGVPAMYVGLVAAMIFAGQMLNFAIPGLGISGHFLGAATAALLLGPWLGSLVMATVLAVQCLVFGDGGLSALGANVLNMSLVGCWSAWGVQRLAAFENASMSRGIVAAGLAGFVSVFCAALVCGGELALSGQASSFGTLMSNHLAVALAEGCLTAALVATLQRRDQTTPVPAHIVRLAWALTAVAILLTPLASALPDGLDAALPQDSAAAVSTWTAPLADYSTPVWFSLDGAAATIFVAVIGTLLTLTAARVMGAAANRSAAVN
ncbi:MAG: energy-coupling factor ABC transporter permease [Planctomycetales bacterium]|nr:energy-coupling factor ABC transporter permease [Planctomycetales bacterium]MBN8626944.1 energy-coupling factor ABC transporter permease [Planctomycetota bacterium]